MLPNGFPVFLFLFSAFCLSFDTVFFIPVLCFICFIKGEREIAQSHDGRSFFLGGKPCQPWASFLKIMVKHTELSLKGKTQTHSSA